MPLEESTSSGVRFFLMAIAVASLAATVYADEGGDRAEDRQAGVILETGEIDSGTVKVGAFAVVIHGLGKRHPVSGKWESLATARGYIQAIDAKTLILGLGGNFGLEQIALDHIQRMVLLDIDREDGNLGSAVLGAKEGTGYAWGGQRTTWGAGRRIIVRVKVKARDHGTAADSSLHEVTVTARDAGTPSQSASRAVGGDWRRRNSAIKCAGRRWAGSR